jgi:tetratricopeptide (TPR) repeat protein
MSSAARTGEPYLISLSLAASRSRVREHMGRWRLIALALLLGGVGGCDTIRARSRAQDGVRLYRNGEVHAAAAKFEEAQKLDPKIPTVWLNLGFASLAVYQVAPHSPGGQIAAARAIAAFQRYLALRPDEERAKAYLVQTFVDTSRYDDAEKFFRPAVEKRPPDTQALATLGTIASKVGRFEQAAHWYQVRIDAEPESADARLALAVLLWDRLKTHPELTSAPRIELANRALAALREARRLQPNSPNPFLYTNLVYRERANAGLGDDARRADLELANAYFRIANGMGKTGVDLDKDRRLIEGASKKADALVEAGSKALPPIGVAAPQLVPPFGEAKEPAPPASNGGEAH